MISVVTVIYNKLWKSREWSTPLINATIITLPKKGNLQICNNYRTISDPGKVMLKVLLNMLKPQAEDIIAGEQTDFRKDRSTT